MKLVMTSLFIGAMALPAFADSHSMGDAEAGEKSFSKCKSCHMIEDDAGEMIQKGGKIGPNLHGVIGRQAGSVEDYRYGDDLVAAGEKGLIWDEGQLAAYIEDPKTYLAEYLDDKKAKSKMSYKMRKGAEDVAAYLATFSPEESMEDDDGVDDSDN